MTKVFVLDKGGEPLMPTHPARARRLLASGKAAVHKRVPFTIRLKTRSGGRVQPVRMKIDPGSKVTGIALVREGRDEAVVLHLAELHHKKGIKERLLRRSHRRRRRRVSNLRHRKPRFANRRRRKGWLPPSMEARVGHIASWVARYRKFLPVTGISVEVARFDTRKVRDPEVSGIEYLQGELLGYEVREYLLEKWGRRCAYCGIEKVPLQVEHVIPRSRGGSDRVSNLALACGSCNRKKGSATAAEFGYPSVQARSRRPMREAAMMNATRNRIYQALIATGVPVESGTGGQTKYNRTRLGLGKEHVLDAVCVGASTPARVLGLEGTPVTSIGASGRGTYQRTQSDAFGFPTAYLIRRKRIHGFATGDLVRAQTRSGFQQGVVVVRRSGYFDLKQNGKRAFRSIPARRFEMLQRFDGYTYESRAHRFSLGPQVSRGPRKNTGPTHH